MRIRTSDLCLRRAALYPAELWVPDAVYNFCRPVSQWQNVIVLTQEIMREVQTIDQGIHLVFGIIKRE